MSSDPSFLPPILDLAGTWEDILSVLYEVFENDFKQHQASHSGMRVLYDGRVTADGDGKEEGFWHAISKTDYNTGDRVPEFRRAERLPWARPLMMSSPRVEIKVFDYDHGSKDKGIRRYIWLDNYDYVLVLQEKKKLFFWITAFHISTAQSRTDMGHRHANRV